ncbi:SDR family NAD(P)-dependent oxidoreductase [Nitrosopumilus piranensis]|uniref:SDR family NAD(P)-dependent oxidoreductase n=1 Tax=Nitrosopumilus piranensis TaxID=1582439 RepID=UPI0013623CB2|nr:SDR family oxidoreductase [Nitrosopumilus piranensis]
MKNKRVLITGANGGIGSSITKAILENQGKVILFYHKNKDQIDKIIEDNLGQKTNIEIYQVDLSKKEEITNVLSKTIKNGIDIFIHAVTLPISHNKIQNIDWNEYQKNIDLQTKSFFEITRILIPTMKEKKRSRIISILSSYTIGTPPKSISPYVVGKYSLLGLVKCMATELAPTGITVNCISPSMTNTPLIDKFPKKLIEINAVQNPLGRILEPSDILSTILFLCEDNSDFITGQNIIISGGEIMY